MAQLRLTDLSIQRLPHPASGDMKYWDTVLPGFGIRVTSRSKSFFISHGKKRQLKSLGRYPAVSLKTAREKAKAFQAAPASKAKLVKLAEAVTAFTDDCDKRLKARTVQNYRILLARLAHDRLDQVTREDAADSHAVMCYKVFFNWLINEKLYDRNPFAGSKVKYGKRSRLLTDEEVKKLWAYEHRPFSDHLKLLILTGQRRNQFSNFEVRGETLFFPGSVMKGGEDHVIPLGSAAKEIVSRLKRTNSWSKNKAKLGQAVPLPHWTLHDARKYFSTTMAKLRVPLPVTERILDHRSGMVSGVAALYNFHNFMEEAKEALVLYEAHIQTLTAEA